ncbi:hypothetical protein HBI16_100240 [Parastagonospora nodorum]|nr:hypothetical protein HBI16_100240 [Parastagonospora nodorum]
MEPEPWFDDFLMPDASDCDPGTNHQLEMAPVPPSTTSFQSNRVDETSLLLTGASFGVESNTNQHWTNNYQESFGRETTVPHPNMASNSQDHGFLDSGELGASFVEDNSILESGYPQMVYNDINDWRSVNGHRSPLPTFSIQHDGETPSDRQQLDAGQGSDGWCHNTSFRQRGHDDDGFTTQSVAGNADCLTGEPHQHADSLDGNILRSHGTNTYHPSGSDSAHSAPWSHLVLHAAPNMAPSCPTCTFLASSSRGPTATNCSCSLLSNTRTSATTPGSAFTGIADVFDTLRDAASGGAMNQFPQYQMRGFNGSLPVVHGAEDGFYTPETHAGYLSPHPEADRVPRSRPSFSGHTEDSSSVISAASNTLSHGSGTLSCPECPTTFSGPYGRGNYNRHRRHKHAPSGSQEYPCEVKGCGKTYLRPDARLKHYRKRHADARETGPPKARKSLCHDNKSLEPRYQT